MEDATAELAAEFVERVRRGDEDAWAELCRSASPVLRALARRRGADPHEADDIVSEVFVRALTAMPRYRADRPLMAWLHGIQRNVLREHARRRQPVPVGLAPECLDTRAVPEDPAASTLRSIDAALAVAALRTLDKRTRIVVYLRVCDGRSSEEVGELVDAAPGTVRVMQARAVVRLRTLVAAG